jgi:hypothetical protein
MAGILTLVLLFDDVFLLHESVFGEYLHVRQRYVVLFYVVLVVSFLMLNRQVILPSEYWILGISLLIFGVSLFFDNVDLYKLEPFKALITRSRSTVLEDAPKLAGIATWLLYFTKYAIQKQVQASAGFTQRVRTVQFHDRISQLYHERSN